jgi:hypothetical protein
MTIRFGEHIHIVPLVAPSTGSTAASRESAVVKLENAQWITFLYMAGAPATSDDEVLTITVVATTGDGAGSTSANDTAIPFYYRLSSAVGTDAWGEITAGTTSGVTINGVQDGMSYLIDVDPSSIPALDSDATAIYLDFGTPSLVTGSDAVVAFIETRYPQNNPISSSY